MLQLHLFSHETRNPIFAYKFSFYNLHISKYNLEKWNIFQIIIAETNFVVCTELWLQALLEGQAFKCSALLGEVSGGE